MAVCSMYVLLIGCVTTSILSYVNRFAIIATVREKSSETAV